MGRENYCVNVGAQTGGNGSGIDGAMAPYMRVPAAERHLVRLGTLDPCTVAPLADAGATFYHAAKGTLPFLVPGTTAAVIGAGGLGQMAIQILKALAPATVVVLDTAVDRLANARGWVQMKHCCPPLRQLPRSVTEPLDAAQTWCWILSAPTRH
ncbi:hypothetical protein [Streptomyces sp. NPDC048527]|uniref:hypothetical protein n=1 Tax=Streptomyces sp. NPDC048527 TaxID=3365568 RepID=UPI003713F970